MKNFFLFLVALFCFSSSFSQAQTQSQTKNDSINYEWGSKNYPGIKPGEVFLMIISEKSYYDVESGMFIMTYPNKKHFTLIKNYNQISWKTKRLGFGLKAYGPHGNVLTGFRPVFVQENELREAGVLK